VALAGKTGFLYVFNRVTGAPLWPIDERPVPKSDMPGEQAWPTQPFPTAPPPFAVQKFTAGDINPYLLTAEERAHWKQVVDSALNEGMFTPPSMRDSISMPGNQGGSNWGTTSSNPTNGRVYVLGLNEPAILKMSEEMPGRGGILHGGSAVQGRVIYDRNCATCHGANLDGTGDYPSLVDVTHRMGVDTVRTIVMGGKGPMPSFSTDIDEAGMNSLLAFLSDPSAAPASGPGGGAAGSPASLEGPVVASGGAPAMKILSAAVTAAGRGSYGGMGRPSYPEGLDVPAHRYFTGYNVMGNIIKPPYTTLTAYDLNKGTIEWRVPVGDDLRVLAEGVHGTGAIGLRAGMVVTATGLVFLAGGDAKMRAYDAGTGKVLWTAALPGQSRGIPAMYEVNGRQYLIVDATTAQGGKRVAGEPPRQARGYVAFALPGEPDAGERSKRQ
jgi:quinoprotein glucose dehydrogenase